MLNEKEIAKHFADQGFAEFPDREDSVYFKNGEGAVRYVLCFNDYHGEIISAYVSISINVCGIFFSQQIDFAESETDADAIAKIEGMILELKNKLQDAVDGIVERHSDITIELGLNRNY